MTDEQLQAIRARVDAATAIIAEWGEKARYVEEKEDAFSLYVDRRLSRAEQRALYHLQLHAYEDIPALLAEVDSLRAEIARLNAINTELLRRYDQLEAMVERRVGELEAENSRLREVERKAIEQSEYIQTHGLTEIEVNALRAKHAQLRAALEAFDAKLEPESTFEESGQEFVAFYRVPAGPWHKILALIRGGGA